MDIKSYPLLEHLRKMLENDRSLLMMEQKFRQSSTMSHTQTSTDNSHCHKTERRRWLTGFYFWPP